MPSKSFFDDEDDDDDLPAQDDEMFQEVFRKKEPEWNALPPSPHRSHTRPDPSGKPGYRSDPYPLSDASIEHRSFEGDDTYSKQPKEPSPVDSLTLVRRRNEPGTVPARGLRPPPGYTLPSRHNPHTSHPTHTTDLSHETSTFSHPDHPLPAPIPPTRSHHYSRSLGIGRSARRSDSQNTTGLDRIAQKYGSRSQPSAMSQRVQAIQPLSNRNLIPSSSRHAPQKAEPEDRAYPSHYEIDYPDENIPLTKRFPHTDFSSLRDLHISSVPQKTEPSTASLNEPSPKPNVPFQYGLNKIPKQEDFEIQQATLDQKHALKTVRRKLRKEREEMQLSNPSSFESSHPRETERAMQSSESSAEIDIGIRESVNPLEAVKPELRTPDQGQSSADLVGEWLKKSSQPTGTEERRVETQVNPAKPSDDTKIAAKAEYAHVKSDHSASSVERPARSNPRPFRLGGLYSADAQLATDSKLYETLGYGTKEEMERSCLDFSWDLDSGTSDYLRNEDAPDSHHRAVWEGLQNNLKHGHLVIDSGNHLANLLSLLPLSGSRFATVDATGIPTEERNAAISAVYRITFKGFLDAQTAATVAEVAASRLTDSLFPNVTHITIEGTGRCELIQLLHDQTIAKAIKEKLFEDLAKIANPQFLCVDFDLRSAYNQSMQFAMLVLKRSWSHLFVISVHKALDCLPYLMPGLLHRVYYHKDSFPFCAPRRFTEITYPIEDVDELDIDNSLTKQQKADTTIEVKDTMREWMKQQVLPTLQHVETSEENTNIEGTRWEVHCPPVTNVTRIDLNSNAARMVPMISIPKKRKVWETTPSDLGRDTIKALKFVHGSSHEVTCEACGQPSTSLKSMSAYDCQQLPFILRLQDALISPPPYPVLSFQVA